MDGCDGNRQSLLFYDSKGTAACILPLSIMCAKGLLLDTFYQVKEAPFYSQLALVTNGY